MRKEYIKTLTGHIIGIVEYHDNGDQAVYNYPANMCLGYYRKNIDQTQTRTGTFVSRGNTVTALLYSEMK